MTEQDIPTPIQGEPDFDELPEDSYDDIDKHDPEKADPEHLRLLEAVLFASPDPVTEKSLNRRLPDGAELKSLLKALKDFYENRGVNLVRRGGMWAFRTSPDLGSKLNVEIDVGRKLSRAAIETLAIIAYHQPVTRGEIEEIRGVSLSKGTLDLLFDEGWIKPRGRRDVPGHPMQWGTTDEFLDHFALESIKDLPGLQELRAMGLLDARPAIEAYSVSGEMAASGEGIEISESIIVRAGGDGDDDDFADYPDEDQGGEDGPMHGESAAAQKTAPKTTRSGESVKTATALDDAMGAVAEAVRSAAQAIERETANDDDGDDGDEEE